MKRYALISLGCLLALVGAFGAGRYSRPARVEIQTVETVKTVTVRTVVVQRETATKWRTVTVTAPDGSSTKTETGETVTKERSDENANSSENKEAASRSVTTTSDKKWRLSALAGVVIPTPQNNFASPAPTYGAQAEYRLLGPIWIGVWGQTFGAIGASVSIDL